MILKQNSHRFFSADLSCESASHHFAQFFFETGSLVGFVVLDLPQYFLQRARKLAHAQTLTAPTPIRKTNSYQLSPDLSTTKPRATKRRALTGCRRRKAKRQATPNERWLHLGARQAGQMRTIQTVMATTSLCVCPSTMSAAHPCRRDCGDRPG